MKVQTKNISIVIPLLNEEESLQELTSWIHKVMQENNLSYEIVFIDDGSTDSSWNIIQELSEKYNTIKAFRFRRNYGKSAALNVGFGVADAEVVITMDADLQDSPDELPELYRMITVDKYDLVSGWKKKRHDPPSKTIPTKLYNWANRKMSGIQLHDFNCGLKAYNVEVVKSIEVYGEMHRYIPVMAKWAGFKKIGEKVVTHYPRKYGYTKFGFERFINGPLDLLSITFMSRFSKKPMHFFGTFGILFFVIGFFIVTGQIIHKMYNLYALHQEVRPVTDQPLFYLSLVAVILGTMLFLSGFLAELISRNSSSRNNYLIRDEIKPV